MRCLGCLAKEEPIAISCGEHLVSVSFYYGNKCDYGRWSLFQDTTSYPQVSSVDRVTFRQNKMFFAFLCSPARCP
jgi:hypothetical protein